MSTTQKDLIIIGSGPAGYTAALYAARANLDTLVVAGSITAGGALMNTTLVENFPGFPEGVQGPELMENWAQQAQRMGAELLYDDATKLTLDSPHKQVESAYSGTFTAPAIILAMGAEHRHLEVPGEEEYSARGVSYCATCDAALYRDKEVIVVGGGDTAVEDAVFLSRFARQVTLVHRRDKLRASAANQRRLEPLTNLTTLWNHQIAEIHGDQHKITEVILQDSEGKHTRRTTDAVFIAVGHDPRHQLIHEQVATDGSGYVLTAPPQHYTTQVLYKHTGDALPGVFACGDLVDKRYRQAITAAGSGCAAALDTQHWLEQQKLEMN